MVELRDNIKELVFDELVWLSPSKLDKEVLDVHLTSSVRADEERNAPGFALRATMLKSDGTSYVRWYSEYLINSAVWGDENAWNDGNIANTREWLAQLELTYYPDVIQVIMDMTVARNGGQPRSAKRYSLHRRTAGEDYRSSDAFRILFIGDCDPGLYTAGEDQERSDDGVELWKERNSGYDIYGEVHESILPTVYKTLGIDGTKKNAPKKIAEWLRDTDDEGIWVISSHGNWTALDLR